MKSSQTLFFFLFLASVSFSCKKDTSYEWMVREKIYKKAEDFVGDFQLSGTHISGIKHIYDDSMNFIRSGYDTVAIFDSLFTIRKAEDSDTLILNGLIRDFDNSLRYESMAIAKLDSLRIIHDFTTITRYNSITGKIWLKEDSIFLDYHWNHSDRWSTGAAPYYGWVKAKGKRL